MKQREMFAVEKLTLGRKKNNTRGAKNGSSRRAVNCFTKLFRVQQDVANHVAGFNFRCYEPRSSLFISSL